ncbi:Wzz/FepE/Etk N-terminal domain-containing protein, partial [Klebsiella pneumoniae]
MTSELTSKTTNSETDEIDLGRLFGELIDYRKLIVSLTAGFTALAVLYT